MSDRVFQRQTLRSKVMKKFIVYTDGGSRGNPGPGALGVVVKDEKEKVLKQYGQTLGEVTNNQAEYQAVVFALKKLKSLIGKEEAQKATVEIRSDSELLIKQLRGEYKILDEKIQPLFLTVWNLRIDYHKVILTLILREENGLADSLVNESLDQAGRERRLI